MNVNKFTIQQIFNKLYLQSPQESVFCLTSNILRFSLFG